MPSRGERAADRFFSQDPDDPAALALIASYTERNDIDLVSLVDVMKDHVDEKLYYDRDGHFTPLGQSLAGTAIYGRIKAADAEHI